MLKGISTDCNEIVVVVSVKVFTTSLKSKIILDKLEPFNRVAFCELIVMILLSATSLSAIYSIYF